MEPEQKIRQLCIESATLAQYIVHVQCTDTSRKMRVNVNKQDVVFIESLCTSVLERMKVKVPTGKENRRALLGAHRRGKYQQANTTGEQYWNLGKWKYQQAKTTCILELMKVEAPIGKEDMRAVLELMKAEVPTGKDDWSSTGAH